MKVTFHDPDSWSLFKLPITVPCLWWVLFQRHDRCSLVLKPIDLNHSLREFQRITIIQHNTNRRVLKPQNLISNPTTYQKRRRCRLFTPFLSYFINPVLCSTDIMYKLPFESCEIEVSFQEEFLAFIRGVKAVGRGSCVRDVCVKESLCRGFCVGNCFCRGVPIVVLINWWCEGGGIGHDLNSGFQ